MARELRKQEVTDACKTFAELHPEKQLSASENGWTITPGDVLVWCQEGKLECNDPEIKEKLIEIIAMGTSQEPAKAPNSTLPARTHNPPAKQRSGQVGQMVPSVGDSLTLEKVRDYFCKNATDEECAFALEVCAIRGLNPFKRDCFFVKYGGSDPKLEIIVAKDYFMKKAMSHPDFQHFKAGVTVQRGDEVLNAERYYAYPGETLLGGWAEAKRKSIEVPFRAEIPLSGFAKDNKFWKSQPGPGHMIRKCAGSIVLREAFPEEFSGLYDVDELGIDPSKEVQEVK